MPSLPTWFAHMHPALIVSGFSWLTFYIFLRRSWLYLTKVGAISRHRFRNMIGHFWPVNLRYKYFLAIKTLLNYKLEDSNSEKSLSNQLYEVTIIFKSFGRNMNHEQKHFIGQLFLQFIRKQILNGDFTFDDGRSAVIHILDAFYRADAQEYRVFSQAALLIL